MRVPLPAGGRVRPPGSVAPDIIRLDPVPDVEIPKRALFKSSEVCEIASVQPYVLRSWESEFPDLGVSKGNGGPRVYRRADVERVLRIKQLVFSDGLTLAGVRRLRAVTSWPRRISNFRLRDSGLTTLTASTT